MAVAEAETARIAAIELERESIAAAAEERAASSRDDAAQRAELIEGSSDNHQIGRAHV